MNSLLGRRKLVVALLAVSSLVNVSAVAADWKAGVAKVKITPEQPMWMSGYASRNRPAEGKLTDLWAKALVMENQDGHRAVLVTLDLIGIDRALAQDICRDLKKLHSLERHQIALCTSHTHTGPVVARNLRPMHFELLDGQQKKLVDSYADFLHKRIIEAVTTASKTLAPATISWGSGSATFAVNRRNNRPESKVPEWIVAGTLKGPIDHDVPVLAVRDTANELKAVVFGYACHCTVLSFYQWSGDYAGFAQLELEKQHAGCVAMFWAGCGGDQNPLPRRTVELAKKYGKQLASAVTNVLEGQMMSLTDGLSTKYREIELPLDTLPDRKQIESDSQSKNRYVAARAKMFLRQLDAGEALAKTYPYPIQTWKLGDQIQFVTLGGEVVIDYAIRLKAELLGKQTWVAGYANDVMAYIPSRRVLREGGYEGASAMIYYGLPTTWAPEVEELIVREVHAQIGDRK